MDNSGPSTSNYKYCLVPRCTSTSVRTPGKKFVTLPGPTQAKRRKLWMKAMRRNEKDISQQTTGFVCEDHFNFEEDMVNHLKWKVMGGNIFLKENVVPHIFQCQEDRKRSVQSTGRESSLKQVRHEVISDLLQNTVAEAEDTAVEEHQENIPGCNQKLQGIPILVSEDQSNDYILSKQKSVGTQTSPKKRSEDSPNTKTQCCQFSDFITKSSEFNDSITIYFINLRLI